VGLRLVVFHHQRPVVLHNRAGPSPAGPAARPAEGAGRSRDKRELLAMSLVFNTPKDIPAGHARALKVIDILPLQDFKIVKIQKTRGTVTSQPGRGRNPPLGGSGPGKTVASQPGNREKPPLANLGGAGPPGGGSGSGFSPIFPIFPIFPNFPPETEKPGPVKVSDHISQLARKPGFLIVPYAGKAKIAFRGGNFPKDADRQLLRIALGVFFKTRPLIAPCRELRSVESGGRDGYTQFFEKNLKKSTPRRKFCGKGTPMTF